MYDGSASGELYLDTPRVITDAAGNVVWQWDNSDPFGNNPPNQNPSNLGTFEFDLRFPGQVADKETNTFYNTYRDHYFPDQGRYGQSDPIGLGGGINTYAYVNGNPLSYIDPYGLKGICYNGWGWCGSDQLPPTDKIPQKIPKPPGSPTKGVQGEECAKQPILEECEACCAYRNRFNPAAITTCDIKYCTDPRGITKKDDSTKMCSAPRKPSFWE